MILLFIFNKHRQFNDRSK